MRAYGYPPLLTLTCHRRGNFAVMHNNPAFDVVGTLLGLGVRA
jgi:hypothetical protein